MGGERGDERDLPSNLASKKKNIIGKIVEAERRKGVAHGVWKNDSSLPRLDS